MHKVGFIVVWIFLSCVESIIVIFCAHIHTKIFNGCARGVRFDTAGFSMKFFTCLSSSSESDICESGEYQVPAVIYIKQ
jgi:hypothetical protein